MLPLADAGSSGADASQLHEATPDHNEGATEEPSSQRHSEEAKASQSSQQGGGADCFDATQYAFFGGNVSTEVELGGLDDEDDGAFDAPDDEEDGGGEALEGDTQLVSLSLHIHHLTCGGTIYHYTTHETPIGVCSTCDAACLTSLRISVLK